MPRFELAETAFHSCLLNRLFLLTDRPLTSLLPGLDPRIWDQEIQRALNSAAFSAYSNQALTPDSSDKSVLKLAKAAAVDICDGWRQHMASLTHSKPKGTALAFTRWLDSLSCILPAADLPLLSLRSISQLLLCVYGRTAYHLAFTNRFQTSKSATSSSHLTLVLGTNIACNTALDVPGMFAANCSAAQNGISEVKKNGKVGHLTLLARMVNVSFSENTKV